MDQLVHFSPTIITFEFTPGCQTTTHLHLRNVSEHRIAYKVKTTHIKRYCVRPNAAIIEPGTEINVELTQQALKAIPEDLNNCRDRFLLQIARIDLIPSGNAGGEFQGYESVMDLWAAAPEGITHKAKFGVILRMADALGGQDLEPETSIVPERRTIPISSPSMREGHEGIEMPSFPSSSVSGTSAKGNMLTMTAEAVSKTERRFEDFSRLHQEQGRDTHAPSSKIKPAVPNPSSLPVSNFPEFMTATHPSTSRNPERPPPEPNHEIDYTSVEYTRERALGIRTAPRITVHSLDEPTRQRVAVERAGELVRTINTRQKDIDTVNRELSEARHRLSDARMATRPAFDVKYEVSESSRVPYAQIAIMAIISGALLQLLV